MLKITLCLAAFALLMVCGAPTKEAVDLDAKEQTKTDIIVMQDPEFVIPLDDPPKADTYFVFYETHAGQLVKNTLLVCDDQPHGTHPTPVLGCEEIKAIDGDVDKLPKDCVCEAGGEPVIVNIQGKYNGVKFNYLHKFVNPCTFKCISEPIKDFVSIGLGFDED